MSDPFADYHYVIRWDGLKASLERSEQVVSSGIRSGKSTMAGRHAQVVVFDELYGGLLPKRTHTIPAKVKFGHRFFEVQIEVPPAPPREFLHRTRPISDSRDGWAALMDQYQQQLLGVPRAMIMQDGQVQYGPENQRYRRNTWLEKVTAAELVLRSYTLPELA